METALEAFSSGRPVIVFDDPSRENEGDIIIAANHACSDIICLYLRHTTGILCVSMTAEIADRLKLPPMVQDNTDNHCTQFAVSCDAVDTKTGVSAHDRGLTIRKLAAQDSKPEDFNRPGHIFPLIAHKDLLQGRQGHTEAALELCRLTKQRPVALISELQNPDGTMTTYQQALQLGSELSIPVITIKDLLEPNRTVFPLYKELTPTSSTELPLGFQGKSYGTWRLSLYQAADNTRYSVLCYGNVEQQSNLLLRVHSECITSHLLYSLRCDCVQQYSLALEVIQKEGRGMVIYIHGHEGRAIGLANKVAAYHLQTTFSHDTYEANKKLNLPHDNRNYHAVLEILDRYKVESVRLLTNNPDKVKVLSERVIEHIPLSSPSTPHNEDYITCKKQHFQRQQDMHMPSLSIPQLPVRNPNLVHRVSIVSTSWHKQLLSPLLQALEKYYGDDVELSFLEVPGSYELCYGALHVLNTKQVHAVLCLGVLIQGQSYHFYSLAQSIPSNLLSLSAQYKTPIINGVLTCYDEQQAKQRIESPQYHTNLAETVYYMAKLHSYFD
jgi:3,4-dihydroxy 2-butanone 4-phosphate synthase / GTP cyclohydrolase II